MSPADVGRSYDLLAPRWETPEHPLSGLPQHERALQFATAPGQALDVGCGCNGRLIDLLKDRGFVVEGIDVSEQMVAAARRRNPGLQFHHADICQWELPRTYDFISGWDSIWHVPLADQERVLRKLCEGLNSGGVLIFTMGGTDQPHDVHDAHMGPAMYHATLGIPKTLALLSAAGCVCKHLEFDQYPELHVCVIAQKS